MEELPEILTPEIISQTLGVSYTSTLRLVKSGEFPVLKIGNLYKIPRKTFIEWLYQPGFKEVLQNER